jgi:hypothetical protein
MRRFSLKASRCPPVLRPVTMHYDGSHTCLFRINSKGDREMSKKQVACRILMRSWFRASCRGYVDVLEFFLRFFASIFH